MTLRLPALVVTLSALAASAAPAPAPSNPAGGDAVDLGVTEETGTSLGQLDVTLTGPPEALSQVRPESFEVWVDGRKLDRIFADSACTVAAPAPDSPGAPEEAEPEPTPVRPPTWLLYFDQAHLTMAGRLRAIDLAREVVPELLAGGGRAAIVSNAASVVTLQPLTDDVPALLATLDRLVPDRAQFDAYPTQEDGRVEEILRAFNDPAAGSVERAMHLVRQYMREEQWRAQRSLGRLGMVLGSLGDVEPPKSVLYFADTMRQNPGEHYVSFLPSALKEKAAANSNQPIERQTSPGVGGQLTFDRVVREAAALGVRFYTVEGQMLQPSSVRVRDAHGALQSLAAETGGRAFVNGATPKRVVAGIRGDLSCLWLLSFDPEGFPLDQPLKVSVKVSVPKVQVRVRGQTLLQSARARTTGRLLANFAVDTEGKDDPLRASFVPLGWKDGRYTALLQVVAPGTSLPAATWDLGASVVSRERVTAETSARTRVAGSGVPVVLEQEVELRPGPYELVAVAREITSDRVLSRRADGAWPDPDDALATVTSPVVLQPASGAFTRQGQVRKSGSVVHGPRDGLDSARPTALLALVCRSRMVKGPLQVERRLVGESPVAFPPLTLEPGEDRCAQIRDLVPARTLGAGGYRYEIVVLEKGVEVGRGGTEFGVAGR